MCRREEISGLTLLQPPGCFSLGRDSLLLSRFLSPRPGSRILDLGCGVGTLAVLLSSRIPNLTMDGVELEPKAAGFARRNLAENGLVGEIYNWNLAEVPARLPHGGYDWVVSNPPYYSAAGKTAVGTRGLARSEIAATLSCLCRAAAWVLQTGRRFGLCYPAARLPELFSTLEETGFAPKRLQLVQTRWDSPPDLALVEASRHGRPGLTLLPTHIMQFPEEGAPPVCRE